jgi:hypothetical protein
MYAAGGDDRLGAPPEEVSMPSAQDADRRDRDRLALGAPAPDLRMENGCLVFPPRKAKAPQVPKPPQDARQLRLRSLPG